jgi:glycosyltransferase involved in cell wall biosynthesis
VIQRKMDKVYLSTVTPVYRGAAYLRELVAELEGVRDSLAAGEGPLELLEAIFVDDAAVDGSAEALAALQQTRPWIRLIHLSRNFGQHPASEAGILHSSGDWVATLDEDLQHHPRDLVPLLLRAAMRGQDVVYASAPGPVHRSAFRNASSRLYKALVSWLAGNPGIRKFSSFRMLRGSIARAAAAVSTHDTYFDVVLTWFTDRLDTLELPLVDVRSRAAGGSGYSVWKLLRHARRMLISSEIKPLRAGAAVGMATLVASVVLGATVLVLKLLDPEWIQVRGWTSLILVVTFFGGLSSLLTGILLEYMSTLLLHIQGKPTFFVVDRSKDRLLLPLVEGRGAP